MDAINKQKMESTTRHTSLRKVRTSSRQPCHYSPASTPQVPEEFKTVALGGDLQSHLTQDFNQLDLFLAITYLGDDSPLSVIKQLSRYVFLWSSLFYDGPYKALLSFHSGPVTGDRCLPQRPFVMFRLGSSTILFSLNRASWASFYTLSLRYPPSASSSPTHYHRTYLIYVSVHNVDNTYFYSANFPTTSLITFSPNLSNVSGPSATFPRQVQPR